MADEVRLIDGNKLLEDIEDAIDIEMDDQDVEKSKFVVLGLKLAEKYIKKAQTIEAELVKHGRWISQGDDMWLCSNCKENIIYSMHKSDRTEKQRYCCRCGAKMDLKDGDE